MILGHFALMNNPELVNFFFVIQFLLFSTYMAIYDVTGAAVPL